MKFIDFKEFSKKYSFVDSIEHNGNCTLYRSCNNKYAIKVDNFEAMIADIDWLSQLRHPNILECLDISIKGNDIYIAMEWCSSISELKPDNYINALFSVFASMNDLQILHGDIKPENLVYILNSDIPVPKIIDFGLTKQCINGLFRGKAHTSKYAEPEYNDSNDPLNYNSILGDGYCLAKTIIELCEFKHDLSPIQDHIDRLLQPRYKRSTISSICESLNIPIIPISRIIPVVPSKDISNDSLKSKYDQLLLIILSIAKKKNISIRSLILCLHNIHRTIHMMNNMSDKERILYGSTHVALASSSFDFTKIVLSSWFPESYQGKSDDIKKMAIRIINEMDGIITTNTLIDTNSVEYALYNTMDYSYPNITYQSNNDTIDKTLYVLDILGNNDISILLEKRALSCDLVPTTAIPMILPDLDTMNTKNMDDKFAYINASKYLLSTYSEYANKVLYFVLASNLYTKEMYHSIFGDKVYLTTNKLYVKDMKGNSYLMGIDELISKMTKNE